MKVIDVVAAALAAAAALQPAAARAQTPAPVQTVPFVDLDRAPDYSWAVVGEPGRDYLWILARASHLDGESIASARAAARASGYDVDRLVPTSQSEGDR